MKQEDSIQRACLAALSIRAEFESAARRQGHALSDFRIGIGVATGNAVAGKIGTVDQVKVTVFGPVVNLYPIRDLEEGIQRANAVEFGLQAAVFTSSLAAAFRAVEELEAGAVIVNDSTDYRMDAMPFGGIKQSGLGREGIRFALQEMTEPKAVCFNL